MKTFTKIIYILVLCNLVSGCAGNGLSSLSSQQEQWLIKAEIKALVDSYGIYRDNNDAVAYANTFAEDGALIINGKTNKGRDVIRQRVENGNTTNVGMHIISTGMITIIDSTNATGVHYSTIYRSPKGDNYKEGDVVPLKGITGAAKYFDKYVLTSDGWKFAERRSQPVFKAAE